MSIEGERAVDLANRLSDICNGEPTVSVYLALSMMIGGAEALAERPDFDGCMKLITETARNEFNRARSRSN